MTSYLLKKGALGLTSSLWSLVSGVTRQASQSGFLKSTRLCNCFDSCTGFHSRPFPRVISVGNLQVGGAGKTPLVAQIAKEASDRGLKVCILSRGYKGEWENRGGMILPADGPAKPSQCGDEPALLHDLCPKTFLGVGANRVYSYQSLLKKTQVAMDLVILDDGFQHWKIKKDLEIVAVTCASPTQIVFRDSLLALKYADLVVLTKGWTSRDQIPDLQGKPWVRVKYQLPKSRQKVPLWLMTGIATGPKTGTSESQDPYTLALNSGYEIRRYLSRADHTRYDFPFIQLVMKQAAAVGCKIALTGKDWVKWREFGIPLTEVVVLEPKLIFDEGRELWSKILWQE